MDAIMMSLASAVPWLLGLISALVGMAALALRSRWKEDERKRIAAEQDAARYENTRKELKTAGDLARANDLLADKRRTADSDAELRKAALLAKPKIEAKDVEAIEARTRADEAYLAASEKETK